MKRCALIIACLCFCSALAFSGGGASGVLFGLAEPGWTPSFGRYDGLVNLEEMPWNIGYLGGYHYDVDNDGVIQGWFGLAFLDSKVFDAGTAQSGVAGGVAGVIVGTRVIGKDFIHFDTALRLGMGACYVGDATSTAVWPSPVYAIVYVEPYAELGIGIFPWMHFTATLGYQMIGNCFPGATFDSLFTRTPTLGFSIAFGSFYY